jgi:phenylalanyl-tRNA synthetase beta subunit
VLGSGRKSLGISVTLGSDERTLTDADVDAIMADIMQAVQTRHNATIRGAG